MECFEILSKFFNNEIVSEGKSLKVWPYIIHGLYKVIWIISFYHSFNFWSNVVSNKFTNIVSTLLVQCRSLDNRWFLVSKFVNLSELIIDYALSYLWLKVTPDFPRTRISMSWYLRTSIRERIYFVRALILAIEYWDIFTYIKDLQISNTIKFALL
jgi:hypothetical protein